MKFSCSTLCILCDILIVQIILELLQDNHAGESPVWRWLLEEFRSKQCNSCTRQLITTATTTGVPVSGWKLSLPNQSCQTACGSAVCNVTSQSSLLLAAQFSYVNGLLGSATYTSVSLSSSDRLSITSTRAVLASPHRVLVRPSPQVLLFAAAASLRDAICRTKHNRCTHHSLTLQNWLGYWSHECFVHRNMR